MNAFIDGKENCADVVIIGVTIFACNSSDWLMIKRGKILDDISKIFSSHFCLDNFSLGLSILLNYFEFAVGLILTLLSSIFYYD